MIRVIIAEDMNMVRGALVALLEDEPDIEVIAEFSSGNDILPTVHQLQPDVALLDIDLPGKDGLTAAAEIRDQAPHVRTLILTGIGRPGTMRRALNAQVGGYILKDAPASELASAIRDVAAGKRVVDNQLALDAWDKSAECPMTAREIEVLRLTSRGADATEIAAKLYISVGTVRNYLTTITNKLNARNRVDAVRLATEAGWL